MRCATLFVCHEALQLLSGSAGGIGGSAPMSRLWLSGWACYNSRAHGFQTFTRFWSASCEELCLDINTDADCARESADQ
eukprot:6311499-Amphidinium_carterae.2